MPTNKAKIFVALDTPDAKSAVSLARLLQPINPYFKIGLELYTAEGPSIVKEIAGPGAEIFLDLKFHDIPNTVAGAVRSATKLGVKYFNVHCSGGSEMMRAAVQARDDESKKLGISKPILLGVTVLTSLDDKAIQEIGFPRSASAQVKEFVELAEQNGLDGVVCSALEISLVRQIAKPSFVTMVPGIRPAGSAAGDQKRTLTPREASQAGANCLVIGRPIYAANDPADALRKALAEL